MSNINFLSEILTAGRFGVVGLISTVVHILIVWLLLNFANTAPMLANTLAFFIAFFISFTGNYLWTFTSTVSRRSAIFRFIVIALFAFMANTLVLAFLGYKGWFPPSISAIFSASVVPVISYLASRLWGFK